MLLSTEPARRHIRSQLSLRMLRWISTLNARLAPRPGYFATTPWLREVDPAAVTVYYDSVSGKPLFQAPVGSARRPLRARSCATAHPLHTRFTNIFSPSIPEATVRPDPTPAARLCTAAVPARAPASRAPTRVISDCHFRKTATEFDRKPGIKWLSGTVK